MAVRKINESTLAAIGNAIRSKTGGSALINPEDMASEIESITGGGGIVLPPNMLDGLTWNRGYFSTSGTLVDASVNKEMYSNYYIEVEPTEKYFFGQKSPSTNTSALWAGICCYNASKGFLERISPDGMTGQNTNNRPTWFSTFRAGASTSFVRVSFRSFGESSLYMCKASDFFEAIKDSAENITY